MELWTMLVGIPVIIGVTASILSHAVPFALHWAPFSSMPRSMLFIGWSALSLSLLAMTLEAPESWMTSRLRFVLGLAISSAVLFHPFPLDLLLYWFPETAAAVHCEAWMPVATFSIGVFLFCLSFVRRTYIMAAVTRRDCDIGGAGEMKPQFPRKRRGFTWWSELPISGSVKWPFLLALFFALPNHGQATMDPANSLCNYAFLFLLLGGAHNWSSNWPSLAKNTALFHGGRRQLILGTLLAAVIPASMPPLLVFGSFWVQTAVLGHGPATPVFTFGISLPLLAGCLLMMKAFAICRGGRYERRWIYLLLWASVMAILLVCIGLLYPYGISPARLFLLLGVWMFPFSVWMLYDVVRRNLEDNMFYRRTEYT